MSIEYTRLSRPQAVYGQKNLLKSQIGLLKLAKSFNQYKKLRKEEFVLKIELKTRLDEAKESLKVLESLLPKPKIKLEDENQVKEEAKVTRKALSLEQEIASIKKKLESLQ